MHADEVFPLLLVSADITLDAPNDLQMFRECAYTPTKTKIKNICRAFNKMYKTVFVQEKKVLKWNNDSRV